MTVPKRGFALKTMALALALSAVPATPTRAAINLITFEEPALTAMANVPGAGVPVFAQLHDQFRATLGVSFSSGGNFVAVVSHAPFPTASLPNIIGGTTVGGALDYEALITIDFFDPAHPASRGTTSYVRIQGDYFSLGSGSIFLQAYDLGGNLIGSVSDTDDKPYGAGPSVALTLPGISRITIGGSTGTVGFDNLEFATVTAAVPEPAAWTLMIAGFGMVGSVLRRRGNHTGARPCAY